MKIAIKQQNLTRLKSAIGLVFVVVFFTSCDVMERIEEKSKRINRYEEKALDLAKENRLLRGQLSKLKSGLNEQESRNDFLKMQVKKMKNEKKRALKGAVGSARAGGRSISSGEKFLDTSIPQTSFKQDYVQQHLYQWSGDQLLEAAETKFNERKFLESSQYYYYFLRHYPHDSRINDRVLYQAGVASYESSLYYGLAIHFLGKIEKKYPGSEFYRSAKLWKAISHLRQGENKDFFTIVDEFRKKYQNTAEWAILSKYYEQVRKTYARKQ